MRDFPDTLIALCLLALIVLVAGEPDLLDALISNVADKCN